MTLTDPSRPIIIRTHDRTLFKKCRVLWDFSSTNRHNFTTIRPSIPMTFGTAIHAALEYYYDPGLNNDPRELVEAESIAMFSGVFREIMADHYPVETLDEHLALGQAMLVHYFEHYALIDLDWEAKYTEVPFTIPIPLKHVGMRAYDNVTYMFNDKTDEPILAEVVSVPGLGNIPKPVLYEGQLDVVKINRSTGKAAIEDHKSTARLDLDGFSWLDLDDQINAYYWAARQVLHIDVDSVVFNFLKKTMPPQSPRLIYGGKKLSKDHAQKTTRKLYLDAIKANGFDPNDYMDFVDTYQEPTYFHREQVFKRQADLIAVEKNIVAEAEAMISVGDKIYPTPTMMNCNTCAFQFPCKVRQGGGDPIQWITSSGLYQKNTTYGAPVDG